MIVLLVLLGIPILLLALWGIADPRGQWRSLQAWRYRDPDANEPSDAAYRAMQIQGVVGLLVAGVAIVAIWSFLADRGTAADRAIAGERTTTSPSPTRAATPYLPPEPEVVTVAPLVGYYPAPGVDRKIVLVVRAEPGFGWWCTARISVEYPSDTEIVVSAEILNLLPDGSRTCRPVTEGIEDQEQGAFVQGSLDGRTVLTAGPLVTADGSVDPGGAPRPVPLLAAPERG